MHLCAAVGFLASGLTASSALTYQQKISAFEPEDFAFQLGGPEAEPEALVVNGFQARQADVVQIPALDGQGISMTLVNLAPCAINQPHIHPRATEMLYTIEGNHLRVGFVEENGGGGAVVNDLSKGDVSFFPQGLVHYQQNLDCEPATFLASLNSEDPGVVVMVLLLFELPTEAIQAILGVDIPTILSLQQQLAEGPGQARLECLERCGMLDDGDDDLSYSYGSVDFSSME